MGTVNMNDYPNTRSVANVISLEQTTSTNDVAAKLVADGKFDRDGMTVVFAREQTAGRGRLGHTWVSEPEGSFIASFMSAVGTQLATDANLNGWLQMIAGMSVIDALHHIVPNNGLKWRPDDIDDDAPDTVQLKWPNDIVYHGMKLGGILSQLVPLPNDPSTSVVVFGVGLNLNIAPEQLPTPQSTSLQLITEPEPDTNFPTPISLADAIAAATVRSMERRLWEFGLHPANYAQDLRKRVLEECWTLGKPVLVHYADGTTQTGIARTINADASLSITNRDDQLEIVHTADVGVLPVNM